MTEPCDLCPEPIDMFQPHVVISAQVEQFVASDEVQILDSVDVTLMHLKCAAAAGYEVAQRAVAHA